MAKNVGGEEEERSGQANLRTVSTNDVGRLTPPRKRNVRQSQPELIKHFMVRLRLPVLLATTMAAAVTAGPRHSLRRATQDEKMHAALISHNTGRGGGQTTTRAAKKRKKEEKKAEKEKTLRTGKPPSRR